MILSEVQRTLVKSPPELWAEISDPESLARHLGEFGEIRITRVHPEQKVEWEAGDTSGTIAIKPSGWGTKVMLTVTREPAQPELASEPEQEPEPDAAGPEQISEPELVPRPELASREGQVSEPQPVSEPELPSEPDRIPDSEPHAGSEHQLAAAAAPVEEPEEAQDPTPEPEPRRGFFARLFRRRRAPRELEPAPLELELEGQRESAAAELAAGHPGEVDPGPDEPIELLAVEVEETAEAPPDAHAPEPAPANVVAELEVAEEVATEQVTAVLTGVLDRLGAAHHRPFSRA